MGDQERPLADPVRLLDREVFESIYDAVARESGMYGDDVRHLVALTLLHAARLIDGPGGDDAV